MSFFAPNLAKSGHFQKEKDIFSLNFAKSVEARILPVDEDRSFLIQVLAKILTVAVFLVTSIAIFFCVQPDRKASVKARQQGGGAYGE